MNYKKTFIVLCQHISRIVKDLVDQGGRVYLVGGAVRDLVLQKNIKDADIEIHSLSLDNVIEILSRHGYVRHVGKKFGVVRIDGLDIDWSLPRRDSKGRRPDVAIDPHMTLKDACRRRDLTMNALALDMYDTIKKLACGLEIDDEMKNLEIIDYYGGIADIHARRLNAIDPVLFCEDPLRFFRVMQFIGRFEMDPSPDLNDLCAHMSLIDEQTQRPIAHERIFQEIKKLCLQSKNPSLGFRWLVHIGRLREIFPELYALVGLAQRSDYHPEGDAFEHTMQALDAAAHYENYEPWNTMSADDVRLCCLLTMVVHDLGKAITTDARLSCHGHEQAGVPLAESLLRRFTDDRSLIFMIKKLVRFHGAVVQIAQPHVRLAAYKKLALKLSPETCLRHLALIARADILGRNPNDHKPLDVPSHDEHEKMGALFLHNAQCAGVLDGPEKPVLLGRDLIDLVKPGRQLGVLLERAYEIQINEGICDIEILKSRVLKKKRDLV